MRGSTLLNSQPYISSILPPCPCGLRPAVPHYWEARWGSRAAPIIIAAEEGAGSVAITAPLNVFDVRHLHLVGLTIRSRGDPFHCERCINLLLRNVVGVWRGWAARRHEGLRSQSLKPPKSWRQPPHAVPRLSCQAGCRPHHHHESCDLHELNTCPLPGSPTPRAAEGVCAAGASWSECGVQEAIKLNQCRGVWIEGVGEACSLRSGQCCLEGGGKLSGPSRCRRRHPQLQPAPGGCIQAGAAGINHSHCADLFLPHPLPLHLQWQGGPTTTRLTAWPARSARPHAAPR
jgi:hypothetical protein